MKRFWLILLSLGLVMAFSASAWAVDVKFSGSFYAAGLYQDRTTFRKDSGTDGPSTAFYYQRLRVKTDFIVSPGLSLVTRFDALERSWGAARATANLGSATAATDPLSSGTTAENENIAFDLAYIQYVSPIGMFLVGIQDDGAWGTVFADSTSPLGRITYIGQFGPFTALGYIGKFKEQSYSAKNPLQTAADRDIDQYVIAGIYSWKDGSVGLLGKWIRSALPRAAAYGQFEQSVYFLVPYIKAKIGPVFVQAELVYGFGDYQKYDTGAGGTDVKLENLAGWVDATVDLGIVYFGASVAYVAGDNKDTLDKKEGGFITGGADWNPCLILFNYDRYYWVGKTPGWDGTANNNNGDNPYLASNDGGMTNALFLQGRVGVRPIAPLDIMASLSWATVDKKPTGILNANYGAEVDITATYKITNNLSYMLGVGYLFVGDYFRGMSNDQQIRDNYLVINKLTLTF